MSEDIVDITKGLTGTDCYGPGKRYAEAIQSCAANGGLQAYNDNSGDFVCGNGIAGHIGYDCSKVFSNTGMLFDPGAGTFKQQPRLAQSGDPLTTTAPSCPFSTSKEEPPILSQKYKKFYPQGVPQRMICGTAPYYVVQQICNQSSNPSFCYFAKTTGKALLGRGTILDVALWKSWKPRKKSAVGEFAEGGRYKEIEVLGAALLVGAVVGYLMVER